MFPQWSHYVRWSHPLGRKLPVYSFYTAAFLLLTSLQVQLLYVKRNLIPYCNIIHHDVDDDRVHIWIQHRIKIALSSPALCKCLHLNTDLYVLSCVQVQKLSQCNPKQKPKPRHAASADSRCLSRVQVVPSSVGKASLSRSQRHQTAGHERLQLLRDTQKMQLSLRQQDISWET